MKCFLFPLRYQQRSAVKLAGRFATTSATEITAFSAISDFLSCILFLLVIGLAAGRLSIQSLLMSSKVKWTYALSSFTPSISLDHFHSTHNSEPVPHGVFTCWCKASSLNLAVIHFFLNVCITAPCYSLQCIYFPINLPKWSASAGYEEWSVYHQKPQRYYLNNLTCISTVESACF